MKEFGGRKSLIRKASARAGVQVCVRARVCPCVISLRIRRASHCVITALIVRVALANDASSENLREERSKKREKETIDGRPILLLPPRVASLDTRCSRAGERVERRVAQAHVAISISGARP